MTAEARHDLQHAFDRLREASFPHDSIVSDELSDLHAELAEYDGHVAGIASSLLGGAPVDHAALVPADDLRSASARVGCEQQRERVSVRLGSQGLAHTGHQYGRRNVVLRPIEQGRRGPCDAREAVEPVPELAGTICTVATRRAPAGRRWQRVACRERAGRAHPTERLQVPSGAVRMTVVLDELVRSALKELADHDYQSRVWTGRGGEDEMASFEECIARLFNDSGLELALDDDEPAYGDEIDRDLRAPVTWSRGSTASGARMRSSTTH